MKRNLIITVILIISLLFVHTAPSRRQTSRILKDLMKTDIGKDIYESIQLELSSGNQKNAVDTILKMLYELDDQFSESNTTTQADLDSKQESCDEKSAGLDTEIAELEEKIVKLKSQVPIMQQAVEEGNIELDSKQNEMDVQDAVIALLMEKNDNAIAKYLDSVQEHDDMIAALEKAKVIIAQLSVTGFLQKESSQKTLAQLRSHRNNTLQSLPNHKNRGVFKLLLKLSEDVGIQADQNQVADIIAIIDELINNEGETKSVEYQVEQKRLERYQYDLSRAQTVQLRLQSEVQDLVGDVKAATLKFNEFNQTIKSLEEQLGAKKEQQGLQEKACKDTLESLQSQVDFHTDIIEQIRQVIQIFESEDVQDVKQVVEDIQLGYYQEKEI